MRLRLLVRSHRLRLGFLLGASLVLGCGEDATGPRPAPTMLRIAEGGVQQGTVGQPLDTAIVVFVGDKFGEPVSGVLVRFAAAAGNGTVTPLTTTTGPDGHAQSSWRLPTSTGSFHATATVAGLDSLTFTATAVAAAPTELALLTPDTVGGSAGARIDSAAVVEVRDAFGNRVAGLSLAVQASGGGSVPATITTDSTGRAALHWTLGATPGVNGLSIAVNGVSPVQVTGFGFPALAPDRITLSDQHGCLLLAGGGGSCWGTNRYGQLGRGDTLSQARPTPVNSPESFHQIVSAGMSDVGFSCGLAADSTAFCWGRIGSTATVIPTRLSTIRFTQLTAGGRHACGITVSGAAWCWGQNDSGELGDGGTTSSDVPVAVTGGLRFRQIAAGYQFSCGLSLAATVYCWGTDLNGQMGHGSLSFNNQLTPLAIAPATRFGTVRTGDAHTCATTFSDVLYCWGLNDAGQASADAGAMFITPTVVTAAQGLSRVTPGREQTCGLDPAGLALCWGSNAYLTLGDSVSGIRQTPGPVLGGHQFTELALGLVTACGLTSADQLFCWGTNWFGSVGVADTTVRLQPMPVAGSLSFTSVSTGFRHSCGLATGGQAYCWGENRLYPAVGSGAITPAATPTAVAGSHQFVRVQAGGYHSCALDTQGAAWCWGQGQEGEIGDGLLTDRNVPAAVAGGHVFTDLDVGMELSCGLTAAGAVWCWGRGNDLGANPVYGLPVPVTVGDSIIAISVGTRMACGLNAAGAALCWFARGDSVSPIAAVVDSAPVFTEVGAGFYGGCGLAITGDAWCWSSVNGGTNVPILVPGGHQFVRLEVSFWGQAFCGITASGSGYCWGLNLGGQFGDGSTNPFSVPNPVPISGGVSFQDLSVATFHACGLATSGAAYCWGTSADGALGTGDSIFHPAPVPVVP